MADLGVVLLVDADAARRAEWEKIVREQSSALEVCTLPALALGRLAQSNKAVVHVLVVAHDLPGMGWQLLVRAMRTMPGCTDLPVLVLGGSGEVPPGVRRVDDSDPAALRAALDISVKANVPQALAPARALVVDDHEINRQLLSRIVAEHGVPTDTAADGLEALAKVEGHRYGLVFLDIEMPRMDGFEAARAIRHLDRARGGHTPIVACTSRNQASDRDAGLAAGMDDYLAKPLPLAMVTAQLNRWIFCRESAECGSTIRPAATAPESAETAKPLPLIETAVLRRICGYGAETKALTVGLYLTELDLRIIELQSLLSAGNSDQLHQKTHALKGTSGCLGAKRLSQQLQLLENAARVDDLEAAQAALVDLPALAAATREAMLGFGKT